MVGMESSVPSTWQASGKRDKKYTSIHILSNERIDRTISHFYNQESRHIYIYILFIMFGLSDMMRQVLLDQ